MKIDRRRNYYMVLDVETANHICQPLCYDIGFAIVDTQGTVYKSWSYLVQEIFFDEKKIYKNPKMMHSAYYAEKLPQYYKGLFEENTFKCKPLRYIQRVIENECERWNVKAICAYNADFDTKALRYTMRYVSKSKTAEFLPDREIQCIWHMTCQTIANTKDYFNYCINNDFVSEANNCRTSAEVVYSYLTDAPDFEEAHTGLKDVLIETRILAECLKSRKKIDKGIRAMCWQIPQKNFHKMLDE